MCFVLPGGFMDNEQLQNLLDELGGSHRLHFYETLKIMFHEVGDYEDVHADLFLSKLEDMAKMYNKQKVIEIEVGQTVRFVDHDEDYLNQIQRKVFNYMAATKKHRVFKTVKRSPNKLGPGILLVERTK